MDKIEDEDETQPEEMASELDIVEERDSGYDSHQAKCHEYISGTPPFCRGKCNSGHHIIEKLGGCWSGQRLKCSNCKCSLRVSGTAPFCKGSCNHGEYTTQKNVKSGSACVTGQKVKCSNCAGYRG